MSGESETMSGESDIMSEGNKAMSEESDNMSRQKEAVSQRNKVLSQINISKSPNKRSIFSRCKNGPDIVLHDSTSIPNASGYLWNKRMLLNLSCQGYANVHFMQPEPATYSSGPALEAKTFLQPEHQYYPGHPGRFVYFRDHDTHQLFSAPFAPVNEKTETFEFRVSDTQVSWTIRYLHWEIHLQASLPEDDVLELWQLRVKNLSSNPRTLTHYPCFNIGNQSWMNQSCQYDGQLKSIVADKISPYQLTGDYEKQKHFMEKTFFASEVIPTSWTASLKGFLGSGDWRSPHGLQLPNLPRQNAIYESPIAVMQFQQQYEPGESTVFRYVFGPAQDKQQIAQLINQYLSKRGFQEAITHYKTEYQRRGASLRISTPAPKFDHFVNYWLNRQVQYHGDSNRLTTDPQTRNYLQDAMGMCYIQSDKLREAIMTTLSQQNTNGDIPDGVLLNDTATLKYINQVPHSDHAIWIPLCLQVYLNETADIGFLKMRLPWADDNTEDTVWQHIQRAMQSLEKNLDSRGLSLIHQGDWCDPMNMVGHKGFGVSAWLSMATSWSFQQWADICKQSGYPKEASYWREKALQLNHRINEYFWDGNWFARGITDAGRVFGSHADQQGKIYLNPQSWGMLCGVASHEQKQKLQQAITHELHSEYGITMLAPAYTKMQEDIGRLTQKFPGVAENGSIYCHAVAFYIYALWQDNQADAAFDVLSELISNEDSCLRHGQLPNFIPNYYRGAPEQHPEHCGRSSRLFNTGTIAWVMRTIIEEMSGLKGVPEGLHINPKLPTSWQHFSASRNFRGKRVQIDVVRDVDALQKQITVNGHILASDVLVINAQTDDYQIEVILPDAS